MSKLRIAFDVKRLAGSVAHVNQYKGITRYVQRLLTHLLKHQDRVLVQPVVFAEVGEPNMIGLDQGTRRLERELGSRIACSWQERRGIPLWVLAALQRLPRGRRAAAPLASRLQRSVYKPQLFPSRTQWDVYHSPFNPLPPVEWTGNAARILTVHDCLHLKFPELFPWGTPPILRILDSVRPRQDYVGFDSECSRRDTMSFMPIAEERTYVIPAAADPLFASPHTEPALQLLASLGVMPGRYILALGQSEPRKNIPRLVQAFHQVRSDPDLCNYVLLLVGPEHECDGITKELAGSGLSLSCIKTATGVDDETLSGLYASAALFAYVSLYEGFGIPVLEAMSAGCPVVVSDISSLPEVAGDAGYYVEPESLESITAGLAAVLSSSALRESLAARGRRRAEEFSWEKTGSMTLDFYESIIERDHSSA